MPKLNNNDDNKRTITISFTKSDDDILNYLHELKKGEVSNFIREAIREKITKEKGQPNEIEITVKKIVNKMLDERGLEQNNNSKKSTTNLIDEDVLNALEHFDF